MALVLAISLTAIAIVYAMVIMADTSEQSDQIHALQTAVGERP